MTRNALRLSQCISMFGPGAMIDLPTRSVVVGGLELWSMGKAISVIPEPRLATRLEQLLKAQGRLDPAIGLSLRTPPVSAEHGHVPRGVAAPVFPAWFVTERSEAVQTRGQTHGQIHRRRRLVRWQDLESRGRRRFDFDTGEKSDVTPIRFVAACEKGHLQDIDWRWVVHGDTRCQEPLWIEEKGTSADPGDTGIVCGCGRQVSLQEMYIAGRLGPCRGARPWLLDSDPAGCDRKLKLLTRTATNTYFPQIYTVISLPAETDELSRLVEELSGELAQVKTVEDVAQAKRFNSRVSATLGAFADNDIFRRLEGIRDGAHVDAARSPKLAEFDTFASGQAEIGVNHPTSKLFAQTLPRDRWDNAAADLDLSGIRALVAVHRLREVSCLYGFTRFEAAPTAADGNIEDIDFAVRGAPISKGADWLPAVEQFGEGVFVHFEATALASWLGQDGTKRRERELVAGYGHWTKRFAGAAPAWPGMAYVLLHSLAHALMSEIALDCGYPASSLKERVYALPGRAGGAGAERCGILIYAASPGAQGTLGGLVATAPRFASILRSALERCRICSNDPVCADHVPDGRSGDRATLGAACHGCLLIAETSCEMRNLFLDRSLLVSTMAGGSPAFFANPPDGGTP